MKNETNSLQQLSFFKFSSQNNEINPKGNFFSLTEVASAVSKCSAPMIRNSRPSLAIYAACIALGTAYVPEFTSGLPLGAICLFINSLFTIVMNSIKPIEIKKRDYFDYMLANPLSVTLIGPITEEIIFRGVLLQAIISLISNFSPTEPMLEPNPKFTRAAEISINISSVLFGLIHLRNAHEGKYRQALAATFTGLMYGMLAVDFGLGATVGAHIMNNSVVFTYLFLVNYFEKCCIDKPIQETCLTSLKMRDDNSDYDEKVNGIKLH